jgi:hypothetical protein
VNSQPEEKWRDRKPNMIFNQVQEKSPFISWIYYAAPFFAAAGVS